MPTPTTALLTMIPKAASEPITTSLTVLPGRVRGPEVAIRAYPLHRVAPCLAEARALPSGTRPASDTVSETSRVSCTTRPDDKDPVSLIASSP